jgi:hypothetical protein
MRLARLAAVGLAIGVIAGFASALLRPRPSTLSTEVTDTFGDRPSTGPVADDQIWDQFRKSEPDSVMELRTHRRVTG